MFIISRRRCRFSISCEKYPNWLIMNGNRIQIKRRQFEKVIDSLDVI